MLNKNLPTMIVAKYYNFLAENHLTSPLSGGDKASPVDGCGPEVFAIR
jgi:hypothetical protein